jgi:hypothetical protein
MARRPNTIPSVPLTTALPEDVHGRLTLHLYSELEGRVPHGAYAAFIIARTREFFDYRRLDLAPWLGSSAGAFVVSGPKETLLALKHKLNQIAPPLELNT